MEESKLSQEIFPGDRIKIISGHYAGAVGTFLGMVSPLRCRVAVDLGPRLRLEHVCYLREIALAKGGKR